MTISRIIIPAAGLGSRMAAITRTTAKELVPLVDRPAIDWIVDEALHAGLDQICVVTSDRKLPMLQAHLAETAANITYVIQHHALGLGHAVLQARDWAAGEPVAVMLPDDLVLGDAILARLVDHAESTGRSALALTEVAADLVSRYGVAALDGTSHGDGLGIASLVEKPEPGTEPSRLTITGRYVLAAEIWPLLEQLRPGRNGEIQLTDALDTLARRGTLDGIATRGERHDLGNPMSWLQANLSYGIAVYGEGWLDDVAAARTWAERRG